MDADRAQKHLTLITLLVRGARRWNVLSGRRLRSFKLSPVSAEVLLLLKAFGEPVHQETVSRLVDLPESTVMKVLEQLQAVGMTFDTGESDGKQKSYIALGEKGHASIGEASEMLVDLRARILSEVSSEDIECAVRVLQAFCDAGRGRPAR